MMMMMMIRRHQSVTELQLDSIITLSKDNFRHACISVYNLKTRVSVMTVTVVIASIKVKGEREPHSRSKRTSSFLSLQKRYRVYLSRAYRHHILLNHILAFIRDIPSSRASLSPCMRYRLSHDIKKKNQVK